MKDKVVTFAKYAAVTVLVIGFLAFIAYRSEQGRIEKEQAAYNAVHGGDAALVDYCTTYYSIKVFRECAANIEYLRSAAEEGR